LSPVEINVTIGVSELSQRLTKLQEYVGRTAAVTTKERLQYLAEFVPEVENLPPTEFFREYLRRLQRRFEGSRFANDALTPPPHDQRTPPRLPVNVRLNGELSQLEPSGLADRLLTANRIFVEGAPGSGKSTLCARLAVELARRALDKTSCALPIFVSLNRGVPATVLEALGTACRELGKRSSAYQSKFPGEPHPGSQRTIPNARRKSGLKITRSSFNSEPVREASCCATQIRR